MPIFRGPPDCLIHSWDIVDFAGTDGRIHRGIVTDVINPGILKRHKELLVDELTNQNPPSKTRLPLERTFRFETDIYLSSCNIKRSDTVQVLLQISPDTPWTWLPGKVILSDQRSFALVQVQNSEGILSEIVVPPASVRCDNPVECLQRIGHPDFVKKTVRVSKKFVLDDEIRRWWRKRFPGTKPCSLSKSSLSYLQAFSGQNGKKTIKVTSAMIHDLTEEIRVANEVAANRKYDGQSIHHILPKELMNKIFRYLYTEQQATARCVCKQWNSWLQSLGFLKELRFDLCGENRYLNENDCLMKFVTFVHGMLAPVSQRIILTAGNGHVIRHLLQQTALFSPCLFDQLLGIIDPGHSGSNTFPTWHANCSEWKNTYTLTRGGVRWSFEIVVIRIYSYHGPNEDALLPTVFLDDFQTKSRVPKALKPFKLLSGVGAADSVCLSDPTRFVFTAGGRELRCQHILTWDMLYKGKSDHPIPSYRARCFEKDHVEQLKLSTDGKVLFAGGEKEIAVLDICQGVPQVSTILRNPGNPYNFGYYYATQCPMTVSDDGNLCFVAGATGEILLWDVRNKQIAGRFRAQLHANRKDSQCIDRSSDGLTLWTSGPDMKVRSWDTRTSTQLHELAITGLNIYAISCCPNNQWIAVGSNKLLRYINPVEKRTPVSPEPYSFPYVSPEPDIPQSSVVEIFSGTKSERYLLEILDFIRPGVLKYAPNGDWLIATSEIELNVLHHPYGYLDYREKRDYFGGCDISADGTLVAVGVEGGAMVYEVVT